MDLNTNFVIPKPVQGEFPKLGSFKTRMKYPKVFKYGADQYSAALDMWFYLLNDVEKSFVVKHGLTKIEFISHQHGVSVGKAFTEYVKSNFRLF